MQPDHHDMPFTADQRSRVAALLGREPRGLRAIPVADEQGEPLVIRVASVVDDKPFPTLYWLVGADLCLRIDRLEAAGWIARLQEHSMSGELAASASRAASAACTPGMPPIW